MSGTLCTLNEIRCVQIKALLDHWTILAGRSGLPKRSAFTPLDLPAAVWPRLFLVDVLEGNRNFRARLVGTYIVDVHGRDVTGCQFNEEEFPGITASVTYRVLCDVFDSHTPQHYCGASARSIAPHVNEIEILACPLADESGALSTIVGAVDFPGYSLRNIIFQLAPG